MAHKLVTNEMVEKLIDVVTSHVGAEERGVIVFDDDLLGHARAALEAVADDLRNQVIEECAQAAEKHGIWCTNTLIRSMKSQGQ